MAMVMAATVSIAGVVTAAPTGAAAAAGVEDEGAGCAVAGLPDEGALPTNSRLPDPFRKLDGTRISTKSEWRCQREEIKRLAEKFVYGEKPGKPASASVELPSGSGPFPAVVVLGGFGADTAAIKAAGAAVINYDPYAVGREGTPRNNKQGAFYSVYGSSSSTGLLLAWAWGVSRVIDVIEQSDGSVLRADATGVTGCSRFGKGAFVIGAFDQRIALTMPIESGSAGVPIFRGIPGEGAQSLSSAYGEQPWLGDAFGSFTGNPNRLPVDTHEMVAMVAPRGLFIMDNPHIANLRTPLQQNIQKFLLRTGNAPGAIRISSRALGNLAEWRDWQTPTLTDSRDTTPPTAPAGLAASGTTSTGTSWTATFTLPAGHALTGSWNGAVTVSGQSVTIRNAGHNGTLAPGAATTSVGFQASRPSGDTALPSGYTCA
jgi:hypothetical protein